MANMIGSKRSNLFLKHLNKVGVIMGWDLTIINVVDGSKTIEEIGEDSVEPVGNRERVISLIKKIFPF